MAATRTMTKKPQKSTTKRSKTLGTTATTTGLAKGARITGGQRDKLAAGFARRYKTGESIRSIAEDAGRSYGFVHGVLREAGVELRGRGGATRGAAAKRTAKGAVKASATRTAAKRGSAKKSATKTAAKKTAAKKTTAKKTAAKKTAAKKAPAKRSATKRGPAKKATGKRSAGRGGR